MNHSSIRFYSALIALLLIISLTTIGCDHESEAWKNMNHAEDIMETSPDSALYILESIQPEKLYNNKEKARLALLRSMALDKNYIDTATFEILQPAIDYYPDKGTADEKLRTYYYQGRIYQNKGDDNSAMMQFMNASDLEKCVTDSLTLARNYVAMGTLYFKQYKLDHFITTNLKAAMIYGSIGKKSREINSYIKALDGYVVLNDKSSADSIMTICKSLIQENQYDDDLLFSSLLSYTLEFGTSDEIKTFLNSNLSPELTQEQILDFARGYSKIGDNEKAINLISKLNIDNSILDSLKYFSTKTIIYEKGGMYKQALNAYQEFSALQEKFQYNLLSKDLFFAEERHKIEINHFIKIQKRDRIIWGFICISFVLLFIAACFYYKSRISRSRQKITEKENDLLRLEEENLIKEKRTILAEQRQRELEASCLILEKKQLEDERDNLKSLLDKQKELTKPIQEILRVRLEILNSLLAKEITNNNNYAKPYNKWIESIKSDRSKFMDSTRLAFTASHPRFIDYLEEHGLSIVEINYLCLYAIGLRGKEVGEYINVKGHYNMSSEIRKKLGITEHETNLGPYIRKKMKELE